MLSTSMLPKLLLGVFCSIVWLLWFSIAMMLLLIGVLAIWIPELSGVGLPLLGCFSTLVVLFSHLLAGKNLISFVYLFKGLLIAFADIRVIFFCQFLEGFLDLIGSGLAADVQHLVIVELGIELRGSH